MIDKILNSSIYRKLTKLCECEKTTPICPVCCKKITEQDADEIEHVLTKRKTDIWIHTDCVKKWGDHS